MFRTKKIYLYILSVFLFTIFLSQGVNAYVTNGAKWASTPVKYGIVSNVPSGWFSSIRSGVAAWNGVSSQFSFNNVQAVTSYYDVSNLGSANGALAQTETTSSGGTITRCVTTFNSYYPLSTSPSSSQYDIQTITTHEAGHWLFLGDSYTSSNSSAVMYYNIAAGQIKRFLSNDDINGIRAIYGN